MSPSGDGNTRQLLGHRHIEALKKYHGEPAPNGGMKTFWSLVRYFAPFSMI
jgi:hypothetical protein